MNACSERCGYCGRCEDDRTTTPPERHDLFCEICGRDAHLTLAGVGIACSRACMNKLTAQHEEAMQGRRI